MAADYSNLAAVHQVIVDAVNRGAATTVAAINDAAAREIGVQQASGDGLRASIDALRSTLEGLKGGGGKGPSSPKGKKKGDSPWSDAEWKRGPSQDLSGITKSIAAFKRQRDAAKEAGKAGKSSGGGGAAGTDKDPVKTTEAGNKSLKLLAKNMGISRAQLKAPLTAGGLELTKLALGQRGMAMLSMLEMKAQLQLRQLFKGIDPSPVIRGAARFLQIFDKASVTGAALSGIFTRTFTALFGGAERAGDLAHTVFQGMVLGALTFEDAILEARIALYPFTSALEDAIGPGDDFQAAAYLGEAAVAALGVAAVSAAIPIVAIAGAFKSASIALEQLNKLRKEWDSGSAGLIIGKLKSDLGIGPKGDPAAEADARARASFAAQQRRNGEDVGGIPPAPPPLLQRPPETAEAGRAGGKAFADGVAAGARAGTPLADAAGQLLGKALDAGYRAATETHSPSRVAYRSAEHYPEGVVNAVEDGQGDVRRAMDGVGPGSMSKSGGGAGGGPVQVTVIHQWPAGVASSARPALEAAADRGTLLGIRAACQALGVSVAL